MKKQKQINSNFFSSFFMVLSHTIISSVFLHENSCLLEILFPGVEMMWRWRWMFCNYHESPTWDMLPKAHLFMLPYSQRFQLFLVYNISSKAIQIINTIRWKPWRSLFNWIPRDWNETRDIISVRFGPLGHAFPQAPRKTRRHFIIKQTAFNVHKIDGLLGNTKTTHFLSNNDILFIAALMKIC